MFRKVLLAATALVAGALCATASPTTATASAGPVAAPANTHRLCAQATRPGQNSCQAIVRTDIRQPTVTPGAARQFSTPFGYGPADLQSAYALPSAAAGNGQLVAVVDAFGAPNLANDLATYRAQYGLPACTTANGCFHVYNQNGQASPLPAGDVNWAAETSVDVEMISATCPNCKIAVIEANSTGTDMYTAINTAVSLHAGFVSLSWGGNEFSGELSYDNSYLNHPGVVITVSSGDHGYAAPMLYPATSRYVTAVGGTSLSRSASPRGWSETAWSGADSGCSAYEPKPWFQQDLGCANRTDADISAVADPNTGVAFYDSYGGSPGWDVAGGTSVSAPIIAGVYALSGAAVTTVAADSYPYSNPGSVFDVTSGSTGTCGNYFCNARAGFDGPTGLGTPNGVNSFWTPGSTGGRTGYLACSGEGGACTGTGWNAFGVNGHFNYLAANGTYPCTYSTFGDPASGQVKACYNLASNGAGGPAGYTLCASENGTCSFSGTASVAFGTAGQFNYGAWTGGVGCNYSVFGDPAPGQVKACYYQPMTAAGGPAGYTYCSADNGTCVAGGSVTVAYGANGRYTYRAAGGSISCNSATLGDPGGSGAKSCFYK
ncbi:MAG: hypothetical protein ABI140_17090 [Jatrophihabitantaceae bacterium]